MEQIPHFEQVCASVAEHGQILPVYLYNGSIVDGALRHQACLVRGIEPRFQHLEHAAQAAQVLFALHPDRAMLQFGAGLSLRSQCELFAARPSLVLAARALVAPPPPPPKPRRRDRKGGEYNKQTHVRFAIPEARLLASHCSTFRATKCEVLAAALRIAGDRELADEISRSRNGV